LATCVEVFVAWGKGHRLWVIVKGERSTLVSSQ